MRGRSRDTRGQRFDKPCSAQLCLIATAFAIQAGSVSAQCPGLAEGYTPVPEFRDGTRLWPERVRPADPPGVVIHPDRDSTTYDGRVFPSVIDGIEQYWSIDGTAEYVVAGYNAGISVWALDRGLPRRVAVADHIRGDWLVSQGSGEVDGYLTEVDALLETRSGRVVVAVASLGGVGLSIWSYDRAGGLLQHYQDASATETGEATSVAMVELDGALLAYTHVGNMGVEGFDVSRAIAVERPCGDRPRGACPGVAMGFLPGVSSRGTTGIAAAAFGSDVVLAVGGGFLSTSPPLSLYVLPRGRIDGVRAVSGLPVRGLAPELFYLRGALYLASIDRGVGGDGRSTLRFDRIERCGGDICAAPVASAPALSRSVPWHLLHASDGNDDGLLYHVDRNRGGRGVAEELFDLADLERGEVTDVLSDAGTYREACHGAVVQYFADAYEGNEHGYQAVYPRDAVVVGQRLYRAATGIFDVHDVLPRPAAPEDAGTPGVADASLVGVGDVGALDASVGPTVADAHMTMDAGRMDGRDAAPGRPRPSDCSAGRHPRAPWTILALAMVALLLARRPRVSQRVDPRPRLADTSSSAARRQRTAHIANRRHALGPQDS